MDRDRFDTLTRLLAAQGTRRTTLGVLLGTVVLGSGLESEAKKNKNKKRRRRRRRNQNQPTTCFGTDVCQFPSDGKEFEDCNLAETNLADCNGCDFRHADLGRADLSDGSFQGASFREANLRGAGLEDADVSGASFREACLVDANFFGANTDGAHFGDAILCNTVLSDGTIDNSGCDKVDDCCPSSQPCVKDVDCAAGRSCCNGRCVNLNNDEDNCGECGRVCEDDKVCSNGFTCQDPDCLPVTELEGDVERAPNGGLTLHADTGGAFGAFAFGVPNNTTFAEILTMETDFQFTEGTCGLGTPRFCVTFENRSDCACAQIPTDLCDTPGASGNSGNLIGNNTPGLWFRICAAGPNINTYADALAEYGNEEIDSIFMVADSSNGNQTVTVGPCVTVVS